MYKSFIAVLLVFTATAALAFPTKVKVLQEPNLLSSEGTELLLTTNKGTITVSYRHRAYQPLTKFKKGQCLILETESESDIEFNRKLDGSGVSSVVKTRC